MGGNMLMMASVLVSFLSLDVEDDVDGPWRVEQGN
jgi:hypothetical protein